MCGPRPTRIVLERTWLLQLISKIGRSTILLLYVHRMKTHITNLNDIFIGSNMPGLYKEKKKEKPSISFIAETIR